MTALNRPVAQYVWDVFGFVLLIVGDLSFFLPVANPALPSGQALGLILIIAPLCIAAAIICIFIGRE